jgi:hypothetical protein
MMKFPDASTMKEEQSKLLDRIYEVVGLVLNAHGQLARSFTIRDEFILDDDSLKNGLKHWLIDCGVPAREQT